MCFLMSLFIPYPIGEVQVDTAARNKKMQYSWYLYTQELKRDWFGQINTGGYELIAM